VNDHDLFTKILVSHGFDAVQVSGLLSFVGAPEKLSAFVRIASNTIPVLQEVQNILSACDPGHPIARHLGSWIELCRAVPDCYNELTKEIPHIDSKSKTPGRPPLKGYFIENGLYTALWYAPDGTQFRKHLICLLAQICLAIETLRPVESATPENEDARYRATLAIRKLAAESQTGLVLLNFPAETLRRDQYITKLKAMPEDGSITDIRLLLEKALSHRKLTEHVPPPEKRATQSFKRKTIDTKPDPDSNDGRLSARCYQVLSIKNTTEKEITETGCLPDEFSGRSEVVQAEFKGDDPVQGRTLRQHIVRTKGLANHISMSNQMLPTRWDSLSRNEIGIFLQEVKLYLKHGTEVFKRDLPKPELAAILMTIFWLSRPLEEICAMRLETSSRGEELAYVYRKNRKKEHSYWQINGDLLKTYQSLRDKLYDLSCQVEPCYSMPLHPEIETIMDTYALDVLSRAPVARPSMLFPREPGIYLSEIKKFLSMVNEKNRCRLTIKKLEIAFFEYISHSRESDISRAILITGRNHQLGATALHYTSLPIKKLQKTCLTVFYDLCFDLNRAQSQGLLLPDFKLPDKIAAFVGSTVCPTQKTVKDLALSLIKRLDASRRQYDMTFDRLCMVHNDMTVYTLCMLGFATGYRAVRNPILNNDQIDRTTGLAVISDKDYEDHYNSRLVWIPPDCIEQLDNFHLHCLRMRNDLLQLNPQLREQLPECDEFFIFKKNGLKDIFVEAPKSISGFLQKNVLIDGNQYLLPLNANRHYLRSNLIQKKCPPDMVNCFMGHWELGEEPWSGFSSLSPMEFRSAMMKYLEPMFNKDGWRPCTGLT